MIQRSHLIYPLLAALSLLTINCTAKYFREVAQPLQLPAYHDLSSLPVDEYWTGIVFNGAKVGFSHLTVSPAQEVSDRFDIRSEAALRIRFLMFDKRINMKSYDRVAPDLSLEQFFYEHDLDGNQMKLIGRISNQTLDLQILTRANASRQIIPIEDKIFPLSAINLYPVIHGLEVGKSYVYLVYDGETQTLSTINQEILAYEESDLFEGAAYKMVTRLHGQEVTTWIDRVGRPLLEISLGGVIISALEDEKTAVHYLTQAALNKSEVLLDFSLIKSNMVLPNPAQLSFLEVVMSGFDKDIGMPSDERQRCERLGDEFICQIESRSPSETGITNSSQDPSAKRYLLPSNTIPSNNQRIRQMADEIVAAGDGTLERIHLILEWIQQNIGQHPVDVFSALDVLESRKAECQGHTYLYAAFARALEIPTKVVNGIVYSDDLQGFLYHTWAESLVNGHWIAIDPTFHQVPADATHIKLVEGEHPAELIPLINLIGKIDVRIIKAGKR